MPIANCFIKNKNLNSNEWSIMASEWAQSIEVDTEDICINIITGVIQVGRDYSVLVDLHIPSLWTDKEIKKIQLGLLNVLQKHLDIPPEQIFIMTNIIHSGRVVENGEIVAW
jgi:hypothetical protein